MRTQFFQKMDGKLQLPIDKARAVCCTFDVWYIRLGVGIIPHKMLKRLSKDTKRAILFKQRNTEN